MKKRFIFLKRPTSWLSMISMGICASFICRGEVMVTNFRNIPKILSTLTGVSSQVLEIRSFFEMNLTSFPIQGEIHEASSVFFSNQLSYSSLYCTKFIQREASLDPSVRWAFPAVDFSKPFSQFKNSAQLILLLDGMSHALWNRALKSDELMALESEVADWFADPVGAGFDSGLDPGLEANLTNLCAVFLASPEIWLEAP